MKMLKTALPILVVLFFVFGLSYYLFSTHRMDLSSQVKGSKSAKEGSNYLDSIMLPAHSTELGRTVRGTFSQITVSSPKTSTEIQKFFRSLLVAKGWNPKDSSEDLLSTIYIRDKERLEVSVFSSDDSGETVFSLLFSTN